MSSDATFTNKDATAEHPADIPQEIPSKDIKRNSPEFCRELMTCVAGR
jgi:hypothetical protein